MTGVIYISRLFQLRFDIMIQVVNAWRTRWSCRDFLSYTSIPSKGAGIIGVYVSSRLPSGGAVGCCRQTGPDEKPSAMGIDCTRSRRSSYKLARLDLGMFHSTTGTPHLNNDFLFYNPTCWNSTLVLPRLRTSSYHSHAACASGPLYLPDRTRDKRTLRSHLTAGEEPSKDRNTQNPKEP